MSKMSQKYMPTYKKNQAHVCSFFVKGECNRGDLCPYRHQNITDEDLESMKKGVNIDERIKERFKGINDPIAKKILSKVRETHAPQPPPDLNISTLFIGGVDESIEEEELRIQMEKYGKVKAIKMVLK